MLNVPWWQSIDSKDHLRANAISEDVDHGEIGRGLFFLLVPLWSRSSPGRGQDGQYDQVGDQKKDDQDGSNQKKRRPGSGSE